MLGSILRQAFEEWVDSLGNPNTSLLGQQQFVHLIVSDFSPGLDVDPTTLTEADFDGYTVPSIAANVRVTAYDEATGELMIVLPPATNGNHWETASNANLPQVIYGVVLNDDSATLNANTAILGRLDSPIQLTAVNQSVDLPLLRARVIPTAVDGL